MAFLVLIARLFSWQVIKGKALATQARGQYEVGTKLEAQRGSILASDGTYLAARSAGWLVTASMPEIKNITEVANKLAPLLINEGEETYDEEIRLKELLTKAGVVWIPLKHKVPDENKKNIDALQIEGIGFEEEETRSYPEASTAAHLLGFVGKNIEGEDTGYFGLEGYYDLALAGKPGFLSSEKDARGVPILLGNERQASPVGGVDLITHIDKGIEILAEKKLKEGIEKYGAKGGSVIITNPKSGAIIASSSYPSYNPTEYSDFTNDLFRDPVVADAFEPGSVFKVIIMAAALDAGVVEPETKCDICGGPLRIDKYLIETWNKEYRPDSTMVDVIVHSDNVGMSFVGQKLGADRIYDYLDKFGIGKKTGIDLQGEASVKLRDKSTWNDVDVATASFGQGVAITPIQLLKAVGAIANQGVMVTPQVVGKLESDGWYQEIEPDTGERIISEDAAKNITAMMVEAAKNGESKWTYLRGFNVAGKTGTAQIPIAGHYDAEKTIASFIGFAPANNPKFLMLVTLKEPTSSPWASETAAPLWYSIAKDLFLRFGIQPSN